MTLPTHAQWCPARHIVESHAVCQDVLGELELSAQRCIVGLHQARQTAGIVTMVFRLNGAEHLTVMSADEARHLAAVLVATADVLDPSGSLS